MYHKNNGNNNNNKYNPMCQSRTEPSRASRGEQKQSRKMRVLYDPVHSVEQKMKDIMTVVWCGARARVRVHTRQK